nr:uncharacterized protein LOC119162281 [Rhipicephalus microplus]
MATVERAWSKVVCPRNSDHPVYYPRTGNVHPAVDYLPCTTRREPPLSSSALAGRVVLACTRDAEFLGGGHEPVPSGCLRCLVRTRRPDSKEQTGPTVGELSPNRFDIQTFHGTSAKITRRKPDAQMMHIVQHPKGACGRRLINYHPESR